MGETIVRVILMEMSKPAVALIYAACRQCYSAQFAADVFAQAGTVPPAQQEEFVRKIVASGHESPLEHVKFTFAVEGVSRALTHQLVRHRIASYSQQSQRYVKALDFDYIVPPSVAADDILRRDFLACMEHLQGVYTKLLSRYRELGKTGEAAQQDARFVLPQAAETKIVITMNCRELRHFFQHRCCARAQWEIRKLSDAMLAICKEKLSCVFSSAGAKCVSLGYCPEGEKFTCGRYPLKEQFLKKSS